MAQIEERIRTQYSNLTQGQKKVAEQLLSDPELFANNSAAVVGEKIGVSETTIIRFCYALEYSGFSQLQREIHVELSVREKHALSHHQETAKRLKGRQHIFTEVVNENLRRMEGMIGLIDETDFEQVVHKITHAKKILTVGIRSSFAPAHWLAFTLNILREDAQVYNPGSDDIVQLSSCMDESWVVVAFSFKRYSKETLDIINLLKTKGVYVIAITDDLLAPVSQNSDIVLRVPSTDASTIDVTPPIFVLLHSIVAGISVIDSERVRERLSVYEEHYHNYQKIMED